LAFGLTFAVSARSRGFLAHPGFGGLARGNVLMTVRTRAAIFARPYKPCAVAAREHEGECNMTGPSRPSAASLATMDLGNLWSMWRDRGLWE